MCSLTESNSCSCADRAHNLKMRDANHWEKGDHSGARFDLCTVYGQQSWDEMVVRTSCGHSQSCLVMFPLSHSSVMFLMLLDSFSTILQGNHHHIEESCLPTKRLWARDFPVTIILLPHYTYTFSHSRPFFLLVLLVLHPGLLHPLPYTPIFCING